MNKSRVLAKIAKNRKIIVQSLADAAYESRHSLEYEDFLHGVKGIRYYSTSELYERLLMMADDETPDAVDRLVDQIVEDDMIIE